MRKLNLILSIIVMVSIFLLTGCTKDSKEVTTTTTEKKEVVNNTNPVPLPELKNPGGETAGQNTSATNVELISLDGDVVVFEQYDALTKRIPFFKPDEKIYWICGERNQYSEEMGNGWLQGKEMRATWDNYALYKGSDGKWRVNNPDLVMGTLGQIDIVNGRVKIRWIDLRPWFGNKQVYDNRSEDNGRVALNISGKFKPEYIQGVPVKQDVKTGQPL